MTVKQIGILYVCLGNICRSPVAEGTMHYLLQQKGLAENFFVDSCGTSAYHLDSAADKRARAVAKKYNIDLLSRGSQFQINHFAEFDYIFAMDQQNYQDLLTMANSKSEKERVHMFRKYDPHVQATAQEIPDMPDPYYADVEAFIEVQEIALRTCRNFIEEYQGKKK